MIDPLEREKEQVCDWAVMVDYWNGDPEKLMS